MFNYIKSFFAYDERVLRHLERIEGRFDQLQSAQKEKVDSTNEKPTDIPVAGFDDTNIEPVDENTRSAYRDDVIYFYEKIYKDKLHAAIGDIREQHGSQSLQVASALNMKPENYHAYLQGMEDFAWKQREWFEQMIAERYSILQEKENNEENYASDY